MILGNYYRICQQITRVTKCLFDLPDKSKEYLIDILNHLLKKFDNHFIILYLFYLQKFEEDRRLRNLYRFPFIIFQ